MRFCFASVMEETRGAMLNQQLLIWSQSTPWHLFARTRSFHRPTFIRPGSTTLCHTVPLFHTVPLYCSTVLPYCSTVPCSTLPLFYLTVPHCSSVLVHNTVPQCSTLFQCSTTLFHTVPLFYHTVPQFHHTVSHCSILLFHTISYHGALLWALRVIESSAMS